MANSMRRPPSKNWILTAIVLVAGALAPAAAMADDQDVIDYREHIMKTMGEQIGAMGQMLKGAIPTDNFAVHAKILSITAATAKSAFEPKVLGGEAKPEVWGKWADFSKRLDDLTAATADLAKTASEGGATVAAPKMQALTCKGCHDLYREVKK